MRKQASFWNPTESKVQHTGEYNRMENASAHAPTLDTFNPSTLPNLHLVTGSTSREHRECHVRPYLIASANLALEGISPCDVTLIFIRLPYSTRVRLLKTTPQFASTRSLESASRQPSHGVWTLAKTSCHTQRPCAAFNGACHGRQQ